MKTLSLLAPSSPASWLPRDTRTCSFYSHCNNFNLFHISNNSAFYWVVHLVHFFLQKTLDHRFTFGNSNILRKAISHISKNVSKKYRQGTCLLQSTIRGGLFEATAGRERMEWRNSATSRIFKMALKKIPIHSYLWLFGQDVQNENLFCNCSRINYKEDSSGTRTIPITINNQQSSGKSN